MPHFFTEFYDLSATDISNISISCLWSWKHHLLGFWQHYKENQATLKKTGNILGDTSVNLSFALPISAKIYIESKIWKTGMVGGTL